MQYKIKYKRTQATKKTWGFTKATKALLSFQIKPAEFRAYTKRLRI